MQKRTGLIITATLLFLAVHARPQLNYPEVEKTSYELYLQGRWKELIRYSEEARRQGIDFFYLKVRTGIAFYNLKKYRTASEWFLKAWEDEQEFTWLQEYLYYSLLYAGREAEAFRAAGSFSTDIQQKIGFSGNKITRVALETGYGYNPDLVRLTGAPHDSDAGTGTDYGEAFYLKNYHFGSFDLSHRITPGLSLFHSLTYMGINREERIDWYGRNMFDSRTNQLQYFMNPLVVVGKKIYLSPSLCLIIGDFSYYSGEFIGSYPEFIPSAISYQDLVFSVSTWSHFGNFSPGGEINYATLGEAGFSQYSFWVTYYPLSNARLYLTPRLYLRGDKNGFGYNTLGISAGGQLGQVHIYGQYLNGKMENFIEAAGYIVSNFPGTSEQKFSGSIYFPAGKKRKLVLRYIVQNVSETYQVYSNYEKSRSKNYNFAKHTLTAGISWNF